MKKIRGVFASLRTKARGIARRGKDSGGEKPESSSDFPRQIVSLGIALAVAVAVFSGLTLCDSGAIHGVALPFGMSLSCERGIVIAGNLSISGGDGFFAFVFVEVTLMVLAQFYRDRRRDAAERRAEIAELTRRVEVSEQARRADVAEFKAEVAEQARRADVAEQARRADAAEQARRADDAERRSEIAELTRRAEAAELKAEIAELSHRAEVAEQTRKAEAERAARLELELELAKRKNGDGESG